MFIYRLYMYTCLVMPYHIIYYRDVKSIQKRRGTKRTTRTYSALKLPPGGRSKPIQYVLIGIIISHMRWVAGLDDTYM